MSSSGAQGCGQGQGTGSQCPLCDFLSNMSAPSEGRSPAAGLLDPERPVSASQYGAYPIGLGCEARPCKLTQLADYFADRVMRRILMREETRNPGGWVQQDYTITCPFRE